MSDIVHRFDECLKWSSDLSDEPAWVAFYKERWPTMSRCVQVIEDGWEQRHGIDRIVTLRTGQRFTIDEKKRDTTYDDVLLEIVHSRGFQRGQPYRRDTTDKVGWAVDMTKRCDYIVYTIHKRNLVYMMPFDLLRRTTRRMFQTWKKVRGAWPNASANDGYWSLNVSVSWVELTRAMNEEMKSTWQRATPDLLWTDRSDDGQIEMVWE